MQGRPRLKRDRGREGREREGREEGDVGGLRDILSRPEFLVTPLVVIVQCARLPLTPSRPMTAKFLRNNTTH